MFVEKPSIQTLLIAGGLIGWVPVAHLKVILPVLAEEGIIAYCVFTKFGATGFPPTPAQTPVLFPLFLFSISAQTNGANGVVNVPSVVIVVPSELVAKAL